MTRREGIIAFVAGAALALSFLGTRLAFAPVPWPDSTAYLYPGKELLAWPPRWRLHTQSLDAATYETSNLGIMPGVPLILGAGARLGLDRALGAVLMTRLLSLLGLLAWGWVLYRACREKLSWGWVAALVAAAMLDPVIRWGTLVVRPETWLGLCWALIWVRLSRPRDPEGRVDWQIAALLALAAYFHFAAIYLVPAVVVGLAGHRRVVRVGAATAVFLLPWVAYAVLHRDGFREQMGYQFGRLHGWNESFRHVYSLFHSLFISMGSPAGWPKFFNLGKGFFWAIILLLTARTLVAVFQRKATPALLGASVAFWMTMLLWAHKNEAWFTTLCHMMLWPWAASLLMWDAGPGARARARWSTRALVALLAAYGAISAAATFDQARRMPVEYNWSNYAKWIDCLDRTVRLGAARPEEGKIRAWQLGLPDALTALSPKDESVDYLRGLDFPHPAEEIWKKMDTLDAILFTRHFPVRSTGEGPLYEGAPRPEDRDFLMSDVPYGDWAIKRFPKEKPGAWKLQVCQSGPFWAAVSLRTDQFRRKKTQSPTVTPPEEPLSEEERNLPLELQQR